MTVSSELLRTFVTVGVYLSFSKAAKANGVSQSAISQSVKQLEKDLNMILFERTTKSVAFTPAGKELFDTAVQAFSILDDGIMQLQERITKAHEGLHIAATDTLSRHFLLPHLKTWKESEPEIGLQITNRPSQECVDMVERGEAQIAIVHSYKGLKNISHLECIDLAPVQDIFVGGPAYKKKKKMIVEELLKEPLLLLNKGASSRSFFDELTDGKYDTPMFELGSLDVLIDLVGINMGVSLVPELVVREKIKSGEVIKIDTDVEVPERQIVLVRSLVSPLTDGASKFIDLLTK